MKIKQLIEKANKESYKIVEDNYISYIKDSNAISIRRNFKYYIYINGEYVWGGTYNEKVPKYIWKQL